MKTEFLKSSGKIVLEPKEDTQYILVPENSVEVVVEPKTQGIKAELLIIYKLVDNEKVSVRTSSVHKIPNTTCMVDVKAVLNDSSHSNYIGKIIIVKEAQQTASYLEDNVLVLGENVKNESQPILEIEADEVKASHGATTGRISNDQLYYLMSRGVSKESAQEIIVEGFFESLLDKITDETIREKVRSKLYA